MSADGHGLLLTFDRTAEADEPFAHGFECGRIWALCQSDADEVIETVHAANAEMMIRIAEATGREVQSSELGDDWIEVAFGSGS